MQRQLQLVGLVRETHVSFDRHNSQPEIISIGFLWRFLILFIFDFIISEKLFYVQFFYSRSLQFCYTHD